MHAYLCRKVSVFPAYTLNSPAINDSSRKPRACVCMPLYLQHVSRAAINNREQPLPT